MILIINSAGLNTEQYRIIKHSKELPLGSAIIVGGLRQSGYRVAHRDLRNMVSPYLAKQLELDDFRQYLDKDLKTPLMREYLTRSLDSLPDLNEVKLIGISVFSHINYYYALALSKEIHQHFPKIPICLGGAFITLKDIEIQPYIRFLVKGNGTGPIRHLASHFVHGTPLNLNLSGLRYLENDRMAGFGICQEEADVEEIPDFSDLNLEKYLFDSSKPGKKYLKVPYRTSIGCPRMCTFCTTRLVDPVLRFKSPEKVVSEIKQLGGLYENVLLRFTDAAINNSSQYIGRIMDILIGENYRFSWRAFAKIHDMSRELLEKFARTGCNSLVWGIESASPRLIKLFNKGFEIEAAEDLIKYASFLGIKSVLYLIVNAPGEELADLDLYELFIRRMGVDKNISFDIFDFLLEEGSLFHSYPEKYGIEILGRNQKDDFTVRENIQWKEISLSREEFERKQQRHLERKLELMKIRHEVLDSMETR